MLIEQVFSRGIVADDLRPKPEAISLALSTRNPWKMVLGPS